MPNFNDTAFIISSRAFGENHRFVKLLCKNNGLLNSINYGGNSEKKKNLLENGNMVDVFWQSKNETSQGYVKIDMIEQFACKYGHDKIKLGCFNIIISTLDIFTEDDKNCDLYDYLAAILHEIETCEYWQLLLIKFELYILQYFGYGLSLEHCAVSGQKDDLRYISPNTGAAVTSEVGKKYQNKLFTYPNCFRSENKNFSNEDFYNGLKITEYFMEKNIYQPTRKKISFIRKNIYKEFYEK